MEKRKTVRRVTLIALILVIFSVTVAASQAFLGNDDDTFFNPCQECSRQGTYLMRKGQLRPGVCLDYLFSERIADGRSSLCPDSHEGGICNLDEVESVTFAPGPLEDVILQIQHYMPWRCDDCVYTWAHMFAFEYLDPPMTVAELEKFLTSRGLYSATVEELERVLDEPLRERLKPHQP